MERNDAGVFLVKALASKYPHAAKAWIGPWVFPAQRLT